MLCRALQRVQVGHLQLVSSCAQACPQQDAQGQEEEARKPAGMFFQNIAPQQLAGGLLGAQTLSPHHSPSQVTVEVLSSSSARPWGLRWRCPRAPAGCTSLHRVSLNLRRVLFW